MSQILPPAGTELPPPNPLPTLHLDLHQEEERKLGLYIINVRVCAWVNVLMRVCVTVLVFCPRRQWRQKDELVALAPLPLINFTGCMPYKSRLVTPGDTGAETSTGSHNGTTGIYELDTHYLKHAHKVNSVSSLFIPVSWIRTVFPLITALFSPSADRLLDGIDFVNS